MVKKKIKYDRNNFRKHSDENKRMIRESLKELGAGRSVVVDADDELIAGNGVYEQAEALGLGVKVVETDGSELVVVKRTDLHTEDEKRKKLAFTDNATSDRVEWDFGALEMNIDAETLKAFNVEIPDISIDTEEGNVEEDDFDEDTDEVEATCKLGDLWQLGEHRLLCGDSTKVESYQMLMQGEKADLCLTDPPYGVAIVNKEHNVGFGEKGKNKLADCGEYAPIIGDETTDTAKAFYKVVVDFSKNQIIFGGNYFTDFLAPKACWLVWDKEMAGNFADVELAWTSFDKGAKLYKWTWNGMIRQGNKNVELQKRVHPTQKPVGMLGNILEDFSKADNIILDSFGGSGSTLIACEQLNRKARLMELDPHYCDVIIARWEKLTGKKAIKISK